MDNTEFAKPLCRKQWLDSLRGLAMIFVIFGHSVPLWNEYFVFTSPIKIPLFFAITGYVFKDRGGSWKTFLKKLTQGIIIPWLVLSILPVAALSIMKMDVSVFLIETKNILIGQSVWYIPACIIAETLWFAVLKYSKNQRTVFMSASGLFLIGLILAQFDIFDLFMFSRGFVAQIFILIGYFFKLCEPKKPRIIRKGYILLFASLYLCIGVISIYFYPGVSMDVHWNNYYNYIICFAMIFTGTLFLFALFSKIKCRLHILEFIGKHTLVFYIWSGYATMAFAKLLALTGITAPSNYQLSGLVNTIGTCALLSIIAIVLNWLKHKVMK